MTSVEDMLVEMGYTREKAKRAVAGSQSEDIAIVMDWIIAHEDELEQEPLTVDVNKKTTPPATSRPSGEDSSNISDIITKNATDESNSVAEQEQQSVVKSIKCDDCNKLFDNHLDAEFHATKTGHKNFAESTEEKKPLTEIERKEQLALIEAKLKQRRQEREEREKIEALEREKVRIRSGKEILEAKKKYEEAEMKKIIDQRRREKEEERLARQRVRDQIEQDKLARKERAGILVTSQPPPTATTSSTNTKLSTPSTYTDITLQIRLTDGSALTQTFGAKEPLSAVRVYVEINRTDGAGPFKLMLPYPKKVFGPEEYDVPLETLGLGPRATLIVSKS